MQINFQQKKHVFTAAFLWLLIWAGYDTGIERWFSPGFPHGLIDLAHGVRAFFPILAGLIALLWFVWNRKNMPKFYQKPLGLLSLFVLVGILATPLSLQPGFALYWGLTYGAVVMVLLLLVSHKQLAEQLRLILWINWIIAGVLAFGLCLFFLVQPGVWHAMTFNSLVCVQRPFEGLGGVSAQMQVLGVAGTRPTGLGRYAGIIALVALAQAMYASGRKKKWWMVLLIPSLAILLFAKGKTELVAFLVAMALLLFISKKWKTWWAGLFAVMVVLSAVITFVNIPCVSISQVSNAVVHDTPLPVQATGKNLHTVMTLSGRTTGIWQQAWHLFLQSPVVGLGFQADRYFLDGQHAHDSLLHALVQSGILGTIPFLLAFFLAAFMLWKLSQSSTIPTAQKVVLVEVAGVFIFLLIRGITESLAFFSADILFMAPLLAYIQWQYSLYCQ
jgi:O-antigen ligase